MTFDIVISNKNILRTNMEVNKQYKKEGVTATFEKTRRWCDESDTYIAEEEKIRCICIVAKNSENKVQYLEDVCGVNDAYEKIIETADVIKNM